MIFKCNKKLYYGQKHANIQNIRCPVKELELILVIPQTAVSICPNLPYLHNLILVNKAIPTKMKMINFWRIPMMMTKLWLDIPCTIQPLYIEWFPVHEIVPMLSNQEITNICRGGKPLALFLYIDMTPKKKGINFFVLILGSFTGAPHFLNKLGERPIW